MTLENQPEGRVGFGSSEVNLSVPKLKHIKQTVVIGDFTDNTNTTGHVDLDTQLPAGAIPVAWTAVVATGFTGDTTAVLQLGVAGDLDRFSAVTTPSVVAAGTVGASALGRAEALNGVGAAVTVRATVTGAADFTSIVAGAMTITFYYIET